MSVHREIAWFRRQKQQYAAGLARVQVVVEFRRGVFDFVFDSKRGVECRVDRHLSSRLKTLRSFFAAIHHVCMCTYNNIALHVPIRALVHTGTHARLTPPHPTMLQV